MDFQFGKVYIAHMVAAHVVTASSINDYKYECQYLLHIKLCFFSSNHFNLISFKCLPRFLQFDIQQYNVRMVERDVRCVEPEHRNIVAMENGTIMLRPEKMAKCFIGNSKTYRWGVHVCVMWSSIQSTCFSVKESVQGDDDDHSTLAIPHPSSIKRTKFIINTWSSGKWLSFYWAKRRRKFICKNTGTCGYGGDLMSFFRFFYSISFGTINKTEIKSKMTKLVGK